MAKEEKNKKSVKAEESKNVKTEKKNSKVEKKNTKKDSKQGFLKGSKAELKKVIWPKPKQLATDTATVIAIVLIVAAIVIALDFVFLKANEEFIAKPENKIKGNNTTQSQSVDINSEENNNSEATNNTTENTENNAAEATATPAENNQQ